MKQTGNSAQAARAEMDHAQAELMEILWKKEQAAKKKLASAGQQPTIKRRQTLSGKAKRLLSPKRRKPNKSVPFFLHPDGMIIPLGDFSFVPPFCAPPVYASSYYKVVVIRVPLQGQNATIDKVLWIGLNLLPQDGFGKAPTMALCF